MAELAFPLGKNEYITEVPVQMWLGTRQSGVFAADNNLLVKADEGMRILVLDGLAWIKFAKYQGIMYGNTGTIAFTISPSDAKLRRIDRVVVRFDIVNNEVKLAVKTGIFASTPVAPVLTRDSGLAWEIGLADVYVGPGVDSITQANITDTRLDSNLCGLMRDGVDGIPTEGIRAQFETWFTNLKQSATGGTEELSEWITVFKQETLAWFKEHKDIAKDDIDSFYGLFTQSAEQEFSDWLNDVRDLVMPSDVAAGFAVALNDINKDIDVIDSEIERIDAVIGRQVAASGYDFDNAAFYKGTVTNTTFPDGYTVLEVRQKNDLAGLVVASRKTVFKDNGTIEVTLTLFGEDGITPTWSSVSSIYLGSGGVVEEVV